MILDLYKRLRETNFYKYNCMVLINGFKDRSSAYDDTKSINYLNLRYALTNMMHADSEKDFIACFNNFKEFVQRDTLLYLEFLQDTKSFIYTWDRKLEHKASLLFSILLALPLIDEGQVEVEKLGVRDAYTEELWSLLDSNTSYNLSDEKIFELSIYSQMLYNGLFLKEHLDILHIKNLFMDYSSLQGTDMKDMCIFSVSNTHINKYDKDDIGEVGNLEIGEYKIKYIVMCSEYIIVYLLKSDVGVYTCFRDESIGTTRFYIHAFKDTPNIDLKGVIANICT